MDFEFTATVGVTVAIDCTEVILASSCACLILLRAMRTAEIPLPTRKLTFGFNQVCVLARNGPVHGHGVLKFSSRFDLERKGYFMRCDHCDAPVDAPQVLK